MGLNVEGKGGVRQRELLINALRMRPDRIIVGEVRGEEALDMLQAMNTGHDGSITTVHANSPRDAISRIETMSLMANLQSAGDGAAAADCFGHSGDRAGIAHERRHAAGNAHFGDHRGQRQVISMQDIFLFEKRGLGPNGKVLGRFYATGIVPKFAEKLQSAGHPARSPVC